MACHYCYPGAQCPYHGYNGDRPARAGGGVVAAVIDDDPHRRPTAIGVDVDALANEHRVAEATGAHRRERLARNAYLFAGATAGLMALAAEIARAFHL